MVNAERSEGGVVDYILREIVKNSPDTHISDGLLQVADYMEELQQRLAKAESKIPKWIPVEERLPEECVGVLVCLDNIKVRYGYHLNGGWYEYTVPIESYGETVTHWMPRPDAPESRKGE